MLSKFRSLLPKLPALIMAAIAVPVVAWGARAQAHMGSGNGHHEMMGWGGWIMGPLMMLAGIAILVGVVYLIVRLVTAGSRTADREDRALALLREQYAKGELSEAEYRTRRSVLEMDR